MLGGLYNLAAYLDDFGDNKNALRFYECCLQHYIANLGHMHPNVGSVYGTMGFTYVNMGEHAKALEMYKKSLKI